MSFKKGVTPPGAKPFVKGKSGNPKGKPRKLASQLGVIGYTPMEVRDTINGMLAMSLDELKKIFENNESTILEKTIANALKRSLEKGSLYSIDTLLSRAQGKPTENIDLKQTIVEQPIFNDVPTNNSSE
jgi:predicted RecB family endonuclease